MSYDAETPRLWLERVLDVERYLDDFMEMWSDPEALVWSTKPPTTTLIQARALLVSQLPSATNPTIDKYALLLRPLPANPSPWTNAHGLPKMIGLVGTNRESDRGLEVGYCVNRRFWGRGYAGEGFAAFVELYWRLEERTHIPRLLLKIDVENIPSVRIAVRLGARRDVTLTGAYSLNRDPERKRDLGCWYLDRPEELGVEGNVEEEAGERGMEEGEEGGGKRERQARS